MNKLELILALRDATDLTKQEAEKVVTVFFSDMGGALARGGLCLFCGNKGFWGSKKAH